MTEHEWLALAAPYALDALDGEERTAFEGHVATCAQCRAEVASFREVAGRLAAAAPDPAPPAELRSRVLAEARRVRPIGSRLRARLPWLAAAAGFVLALLLGGAWWRERGERLALAAEVAARDSTLAAMLGPEVHVVSLASTGREPTARVFWNHRRQVFFITAFDLPPAPAGRTYQLWAIAKDKAPLSMGTFTTNAAGRATLIVPVDSAITALGFIDLCGLTEEPAGGSPQPTETPRLLGSWRHTD